MNRPAASGVALLLTLFLTALSSLVYELVWTRKLSHIFGTSALAESSVLAVFMGGLALGSWLGGYLLARYRNPYRFLAAVEMLIGASCLLALTAIALAHRRYGELLDLAGGSASYTFNVVLFLVTSLILIVPTFLIGVAFPCIVELYHRERRRIGQTVGSCYMVDTLGGALGLLVAAYFLIPRIGFLRVSVLASMINLALALFLLVAFGNRQGRDEPGSATMEAATAQPALCAYRRWGAVAVFFWTGFGALTFEVIWIRHVSLIYGGSLYSFAAVVISFLLGLGLGSWLHNLLLRGVVNKVRLFSSIVLLIGVSGVLLTATLPRFEALFLRLYDTVDSYGLFITALTVLCIGVMLPTTTLMGATLPVLSSVYASRSRVGVDVGRLFSVNSFGALLGSFSTGFFIIPLLGISNSAFVAGAIYVGAAFAFLFMFEESRRTRLATSSVFVLLVAASLGAWAGVRKADHLYNGAFYLGTVYDDYVDEYLEQQRQAQGQLRFLRHSPYGQVAVYGGETVTLTNNGKVEFSSDPAGLLPRDIMAHASVTSHHDPQDALIIGLGGGWTLAALLRHELRSVTVVEINPVVVEANREVMRPFNLDAMADPRTRVVVSDGRNYLAGTADRYDLILSEPPEIWVSGVSSLWTREFYAAVERALRPGGVFCQWVPRYDMTEQDYRTALNTIRLSFPYLYEFDMLEVTGLEAFRELLVLASTRPLDPRRITEPPAVELGSFSSDRSAYLAQMSLLSRRTFKRGHVELAGYLAGTPPINTDDLPVLEFHTLRNRFRKFHAEYR